MSFFGFMLLGPAVLIALRVYLQIYVEHSDRLDRLTRSVAVVRAPTLVPLQNSLIRLFSGLIFYVLLPVTMMLFAWKAAVFPAWGSALSTVAVAVIVSHVMLLFSRFSWRSKVFLSVSAAIIAGGVMLGFKLPHRQFDLERANLAGQWLLGEDLRKANLSRAKLSDANLSDANLSDANLSDANLSGADLSDADLSRADLSRADLNRANLSDTKLIGADLSDADLSRADLSDANLNDAKLIGADLSDADLGGATLDRAQLGNADLTGANLSDATDLTQTQLDVACGNANTKLPESLTLKPCSTD